MNGMDEMLDDELTLGAENAEEQSAEETVEGEESTAVEENQPKTYTEEEFEQAVKERAEQLANQRVDEILPSKLERRTAKIRRELEEEFAPHKAAGEVIKAGLGADSVSDATERLRQYYEEKGIAMPARNPQAGYSEADMKILAQNEAKQIIELGFDEVVEEVERLAAKGVDKMTAREKLVFAELAGHRSAQESRQELLGMGAKGDVIDSSEFKAYASLFNKDVPLKQVYEMYTKTHETKPHIEKMGSMTNQSGKEEKDFFTSEEVDKLTAKDYEDPNTMAKVRRSMLQW